MGKNKKYASDPDFVWTFLHELAHIVANTHGLQYTGTCPCIGHRRHRGHGHDEMWKQCCVLLGVPEMKRLHSGVMSPRFLSLVETAKVAAGK